LEVKEKLDNYKHRIGEMKVSNQELELECIQLENDILTMQKKKMVSIAFGIVRNWSECPPSHLNKFYF